MVIRIFTDSILIVLMIFTLSLTILPFISEAKYDAAERFISQYKWAKAEAMFEEAIKIDPFNAEYYAQFGKFILYKSQYSTYKQPLLYKAEDMFRRAIRVNPRDADYWIAIGRIKIEEGLLFYADQITLVSILINEAMEYFKEAIKNDPNGFNVNYSIGYAGISAWPFLDKEDKEFIINKLKYSLKMRPRYGKYIYAKLWKYTDDFKILQKISPGNLQSNRNLYNFVVVHNLWQFRREQDAVVGIYRLKEEKEKAEMERNEKSIEIDRFKRTLKYVPGRVILNSNWKGNVPNTKHIYEYGNMYWTGTIRGAIDMPAGPSVISIQARGEPAENIYPYMIVDLDGEVIGETFVDNAGWEKYFFKANTEAGIKILSITFVNDYGDKKEDRNLYIGEARAE